ncbi:DUF883 family protein [Maribius pontilimi]|uniref:DUF883 family protein n=1 Tax=Palleronia pontilimi TaxID=1964209 RepID=A0A934MCT8_9RHOB|nr:DUF883 family protein [Palleronia pontilimi]MBJ3761626.1 DUF883 family protein [Palleronia pontilimi]
MADTPKTKTAPSTEDLSAQVELLKADISRLTETIGELGKAKGREYANEAKRRAESVRSEAEQRARAARGHAEDKVDEIEAYVRQNPATALGIAAFIGLIVGFLTRR